MVTQSKLDTFKQHLKEIKRDFWWGGRAPDSDFGIAPHLFAEAFAEHEAASTERIRKLESEVESLKARVAELETLEADGK